MDKRGFTSVSQYLAAQPKERRALLAKVRGAIKKALPNAEEVISYQIPAYKVGGRNVIFFAGWKSHYAIYPIGALVAASMADELADFEISKGTIRFPLDAPVPVRLIGRIAKLRAKEIAELGPAKQKVVKKTAAKKKAVKRR